MRCGGGGSGGWWALGAPGPLVLPCPAGPPSGTPPPGQGGRRKPEARLKGRRTSREVLPRRQPRRRRRPQRKPAAAAEALGPRTRPPALGAQPPLPGPHMPRPSQQQAGRRPSGPQRPRRCWRSGAGSGCCLAWMVTASVRQEACTLPMDLPGLELVQQRVALKLPRTCLLGVLPLASSPSRQASTAASEPTGGSAGVLMAPPAAGKRRRHLCTPAAQPRAALLVGPIAA